MCAVGRAVRSGVLFACPASLRSAPLEAGIATPPTPTPSPEKASLVTATVDGQVRLLRPDGRGPHGGWWLFWTHNSSRAQWRVIPICADAFNPRALALSGGYLAMACEVTDNPPTAALTHRRGPRLHWSGSVLGWTAGMLIGSSLSWWLAVELWPAVDAGIWVALAAGLCASVWFEARTGARAELGFSVGLQVGVLAGLALAGMSTQG